MIIMIIINSITHYFYKLGSRKKQEHTKIGERKKKKHIYNNKKLMISLHGTDIPTVQMVAPNSTDDIPHLHSKALVPFGNAGYALDLKLILPVVDYIRHR